MSVIKQKGRALQRRVDGKSDLKQESAVFEQKLGLPDAFLGLLFRFGLRVRKELAFSRVFSV